MTSQPSIVGDVLKTMGFDQSKSSFLPIANEENQKLLELVHQLTGSKNDKTSIVQYYGTRLQKIRDHYRATELEFDQNLKLLAADKNQHDTEDHLLKVAEREDSRLKQQVKDLEKEQTELDGNSDTIKNEIYKLNASMEKMSDTIKWTKSILCEWKEAMEQNEETNQLIEKYCKADMSRAESLESKRRLVQVAIDKRRKILVNASEEQRSLEQTLERTSQLYRKAHLERRNMVTTWKDAVSQMTQREKDIKDAENEIIRAREETRRRSDRLDAESERLDEWITKNREMEELMEQLNESQSNLKNRNTHLESVLLTNGSELGALRKSVQNLAQKVASQRHKNRQLLVEETDKEALVKTGQEDLEGLKKKHENFKSKSSSAQERLKQLDSFLEAEERNITTIEEETTRLSNAHYRAEQQLNKLKDQERLMNIEAQSTEGAIDRIKGSIKAQEKELSHQWEISYNIEFKIQQAEMRIANMEGSITPEEELRFEEQIRELTREFEAKKDSHDKLSGQIKYLEDQMRKITAEIKATSQELERISDRLGEKKMMVESGTKVFKQAIADHQERLVEQSLLRMRISQIEKQLEKQEDRAYTLEKHKIELEAAITERLLDIKAQSDMLALRKKYLLEERSQLRADISERGARTDQLKKRYECAMDLLGKNDDGSLVTATQIKIETAQEKFILLKEGNDLNEKVLKAEEEIKMMENTLKIMNLSNDSYRRSFEKAEDNSAEIKALTDLQNENCKAVNHLKNLRHSLSTKMQKIETLTTEREELERDLEEAERIRLDSNDATMRIQKELLDQRVKLERAERELRMAIKAVRTRYSESEFLHLFERDLNTREIEERDNSALQQLADLVDSYPDMGPSVTKYLYEKGLKMPTAMARAKSSGSFRSEGSEYNMKMEHVCSRLSHRSFMSSSSSSISNQGSKATSKATAAMSVVQIDFPESSITSARSSLMGGKLSGKLTKKGGK